MLKKFMIVIFFGFFISNIVASDAETQNKKLDVGKQAINIDTQNKPKKLSIEEQIAAFVYDQNESSEGFTAPSKDFSSEGYLSYADEIWLKLIRQGK